MTSFLMHMAVGILCAELILRMRTAKDSKQRSEDRFLYWMVGLIGGLIPDLDVLPALITGVNPYTYHHIFTHTFLAIGIVGSIVIFFRKNKLMLPLFVAFSMHLVVDYLDNSISPLGPFLPTIEVGLLCGWGVMPGSWASEFWLLPQYKDHYLWSIFLHNGWGIPFGAEFISYYDLFFMGVFIALLVLLIRFGIKRKRK